MLLLKHEVCGEKSCFMYSGEVAASCEEVQEIETFSREEGALVLNLLTNTCLGEKMSRKNRRVLTLVGCLEAPLWTLEITSTEPRLVKLKMKGTELCTQYENPGDEEYIYYRGFVADCTDDYRQEFLLQPRRTKMMGFVRGEYCHRPISTPGNGYIYISPRLNLDVTKTLDEVTFVRKSQMEFPCYWNVIGNGELVWTDSSATSSISNPPPFVLPGDQALVRCEEGFMVQTGGEWNKEIRITCTGNITQKAPTCEKEKLDLMIYLNIGQASLILILVSVIVSLIHRITK